MKREIQLTSDGSSTLFVPELEEHYHSVHGALQESLHVFIDAGLKSINKTEIKILEIGFGTGLNAWLTALHTNNQAIKVHYTGIEKYPLQSSEIDVLNYHQKHQEENGTELFQALHNTTWESWNAIHPNFSLKKVCQSFKEIEAKNEFDLIYFDAFAPRVQPDLWSVEIFTKMFGALKPGGKLVTYCAKGQVKRNLKECGFILESLPGPPGKREMTRVTKPT